MEGIDAQRLASRPTAAEEMMALMRHRGGAPALVGAFALLHALLLQVGYFLKITITDPSVMWPSAGLALATLWLTPRRLWPAILAVQFGVEVATAALWMSSFNPALVSLYTLANMTGALVGASFARWCIHGLVFLRAREVLWFVVITAVAAAVSASMALPVHLMALGDVGLEAGRRSVMWQIWAAGQWAGIITVAPVLVSWLSPMRARFMELRLRSRGELLLLTMALIGASIYVWLAPGRAQTLLQLPTTIVLLMIIAVMRLPPRWVVTLFSLTALTLATMASRAGPLPPEMAITGIGQLQIFIVTLGLLAFMLSATLTERTITARQLRESESRYRNFVELSTEAMWRIEFAQPMPVGMPADAQVAWLRAQACIAEYSRSYELLDRRACGTHGKLAWDPAVPWVAAFEAQLAQAAGKGFTLDGLRFEVESHGRRHAFVACFNGVVDAQH